MEEEITQSPEIEGAEEAPPSFEEPVAEETPQAEPALSPEEIQAIRQQNEYLAYQVSQLGQALQGMSSYMPVLDHLGNLIENTEEESFDPYDPESVEKYIQSRIEQAISPFAEQIQQMNEARGMERAEQLFSGIEKEIGPFDRRYAHLLYQGFRLQGMDPYDAIFRSAVATRQLAEQERNSAIEEYKKTLENVGGAARDVTTGASAAVEAPNDVYVGPGWGKRNAQRVALDTVPITS